MALNTASHRLISPSSYLQSAADSPARNIEASCGALRHRIPALASLSRRSPIVKELWRTTSPFQVACAPCTASSGSSRRMPGRAQERRVPLPPSAAVGSSGSPAAGSVGGAGALTPELKEALDKFVSTNKVVLFMKGTKLFPQCGFSNTCVQILNLMSVPYETVNILEDDQLRQALKEYSTWPTFPQLYIDGEFFGGCDITVEAFQSGELKEILEKSMLT